MIIFACFNAWTGDPPGEDLKLLTFHEEQAEAWVAKDPYKSSGEYSQSGRYYECWKIGVEQEEQGEQ